MLGVIQGTRILADFTRTIYGLSDGISRGMSPTGGLAHSKAVRFRDQGRLSNGFRINRRAALALMRQPAFLSLCRRGRRDAGRSTPSGSASISGRGPWAAGTKTVPLPTAIQCSPLRGLRTGSGQISAPPVSSQKCGTRSAESGGEARSRRGGFRRVNHARRKMWKLHRPSGAATLPWL